MYHIPNPIDPSDNTWNAVNDILDRITTVTSEDELIVIRSRYTENYNNLLFELDSKNLGKSDIFLTHLRNKIKNIFSNISHNNSRNTVISAYLEKNDDVATLLKHDCSELLGALIHLFFGYQIEIDIDKFTSPVLKGFIKREIHVSLKRRIDSISKNESERLAIYNQKLEELFNKGTIKLTENEALLKEIMSSTNNEQNKLEERVAKTEALVSQFPSRIDVLFEKNETYLKETLGEIDQFKEESKSSIDNYRNEIKESINLEKTRTLWRDRAHWARAGFWVFGFLAVAILTSIVGILALYPSSILSYISQFSAALNVGATPVSSAGENSVTSFLLEAGRLAFVSVPLIAIFWLVRVLFRLCLRSLAMMDDAEHRRVMLDTYLFLTSEGKVTEEERPFVLQALFRPVPGTDGQDIAPPSITDVIQATKGKPS